VQDVLAVPGDREKEEGERAIAMAAFLPISACGFLPPIEDWPGVILLQRKGLVCGDDKVHAGSNYFSLTSQGRSRVIG
jgi:hypothetical protein